MTSPSHPLYALVRLKEAEDFSLTAKQLLEELEDLKVAADKSLVETELFVDFRDDDLTGWYITGEAFAKEPTRFCDLQQGSNDHPFAHVGTVHSEDSAHAYKECSGRQLSSSTISVFITS